MLMSADTPNSLPFGKEDESAVATEELKRELDFFRTSNSRYRPILAKGGASASEIVLRDRSRFEPCGSPAALGEDP
jgi:hypothetical protein